MGDTEKRLVLFLVLSVGIVYFFTIFNPPTKPVTPPPPAAAPSPAAPESASADTPTASTAPDAPPPAHAAKAPVEERTVTIETPLYRAQLSTTGAVITRWELATYKETVKGDEPVVLFPPLDIKPARSPLSLTIPGLDSAAIDQAVYRLEGGDARLTQDHPSTQLRFVADLPSPDHGKPVRVEKELVFHEESYRVDVAVRVDGVPTPYQLTLGDSFAIHQGEAQWQQQFIGHRGAVTMVGGELSFDQPDKMADAPVAHAGEARWSALEGKYFIAALIPRMPAGEAVVTKVGTHGIITGLTLPAGQRHELALYAGPKEYKRLTALQVGLEQTIDFGWFMFWSLTLVQIIAKPLFLLLQFVHGFTQNYGAAIIIVTALIKLLFVPLTHKSYTSMKAMQTLQPKMAELQKKYKDDKERFNKELFLLYKTHKVNPLSGCLPMLLQIPVFVAFFNILYTTIELRHAPFILWVHDLSSQDPFYVLPIVMGVTMFIQQKIQPTAMDPRQAKMMLMLPVIFTFFFLTFPAGLVLYWLVNNVLTILQQYVTIKLQKPTPAASS